jgi:hypothetical protein
MGYNLVFLLSLFLRQFFVSFLNFFLSCHNISFFIFHFFVILRFLSFWFEIVFHAFLGSLREEQFCLAVVWQFSFSCLL